MSSPLPAGPSPRLERARLSLEGLSVGDAFGERFFVAPDELVTLLQSRAPPPGPWSWTDDTAMALALVESLAAHDALALDDFASRLARRYLADPQRGYGRGAHGILQRIAVGEPWAAVAGEAFGGTGSMGNGSAMRVAPLGAYFADDLDAVVEAAARSAAPTHAHPEAAAGAVAIAVAAAVAWREGVEGRATLFQAVLDHTPASKTRAFIEEAAGLALTTPVGDAARRLGNGSSVVCHDTVPLCVWMAARHLDDFEAAMWSTVAALGDRDTTCAIVGGIVVGATGRASIPPAWLAAREPLPQI